MKYLIKNANRILNAGLVVPGDNGLYDVDGNTVQVIKKSNKKMMLCSCTGCKSRENNNNMCSSKVAVILFEAEGLRK